MKAKLVELAKSYQTFLAESAQKAVAEFAPHQKAIAALMPKMTAANKGEKVDFTPEEQVILKNAAAAAQKFEAMSVMFVDKMKAALATQLNNVKIIRAAAAKYIETTVYKLPSPLEKFLNEIKADYKVFGDKYDSKFTEYRNIVNYKVATQELSKFYEEAISEAQKIIKKIDDHQKNNPADWQADLDYAAIIISYRGTITTRIETIESDFTWYKDGIKNTNSRFNSPLLNDRNADNLSGIADDYNDPEVRAIHQRTKNKNSGNNNAISDVLNREINKNSNNSNPIPEPNPEIPDDHNEDIYHDFAEVPLIQNGMTSDDVVQGKIGNCYLMSTMASVANNPRFRDVLSKNIKQIHANLYEVTLYVKTLDKDGKPTERLPKKVRVDTDFPVDTQGNILYAQIRGDIWVAIIEKAYAKEFGGYDDIGEGDTAINAMAALTNIEPADFSVNTIQGNKELRNNFIAKMNSKKAIMTFISQPEGTEIKKSVLEGLAKKGMTVELSHAYSFVSYSNNQIHLRNPHGENHLTITFDELYACFLKITYVSN